MSIIAISQGLRDLFNRGDTGAHGQNGYPSGDTLAGVFEACQRTLTQAVETMSEEDMAWRPFPETPSAGYYLWHVARVQDALVISRSSTGRKSMRHKATPMSSDCHSRTPGRTTPRRSARISWSPQRRHCWNTCG